MNAFDKVTWIVTAAYVLAAAVIGTAIIFVFAWIGCALPIVDRGWRVEAPSVALTSESLGDVAVRGVTAQAVEFPRSQDFDGDGDVDLADFNTFMIAFGEDGYDRYGISGRAWETCGDTGTTIGLENVQVLVTGDEQSWVVTTRAQGVFFVYGDPNDPNTPPKDWDGTAVLIP